MAAAWCHISTRSQAPRTAAGCVVLVSLPPQLQRVWYPCFLWFHKFGRFEDRHAYRCAAEPVAGQHPVRLPCAAAPLACGRRCARRSQLWRPAAAAQPAAGTSIWRRDAAGAAAAAARIRSHRSAGSQLDPVDIESRDLGTSFSCSRSMNTVRPTEKISAVLLCCVPHLLRQIVHWANARL